MSRVIKSTKVMKYAQCGTIIKENQMGFDIIAEMAKDIENGGTIGISKIRSQIETATNKLAVVSTVLYETMAEDVTEGLEAIVYETKKQLEALNERLEELDNNLTHIYDEEAYRRKEAQGGKE